MIISSEARSDRSRQFAQVGWSASGLGRGVSGRMLTMSSSVYRSNAENCLRMARTARNDQDKPFWLNLAQPFLQLAEHSARGSAELEVEGSGTSAH